MKKIIISLIASALTLASYAQIGQGDTTLNSADRIILSNSKITLGGYAQIDYNQALNNNGTNKNGKMDVHRMVFLTGYKFSDNLSFVTELELEHVKEVYVEQAFVNWRLNDYMNFRGGLMLVPMGIVNEYHEPVTYNGIERPNLDKYIIPSTWREMGAGFSGTIAELNLRYQAYIMNGFSSFDGSAKFSGKSALRGGRQKGAESTFSNLNYTSKIEYYGISKLKVGVSGYFGKSQSTLYNNVGDENFESATADSSVVGLSMVSLDARYKNKGFEARAQYVLGNISNTTQYNTMFGTNLGSSIQGYYIEAGYDVLRLFPLKTDKRLVVFGRYENYDTHNKVEKEMTKNESYNRTDVTLGLTFHIASGVALKADFQQFKKEEAGSSISNQVNFGIGVWF